MYRRLAVMLACLAFTISILQAQTETSQPGQSEVTSGNEDWTTIYLAKSGLPLHATGGVVLSKIELQQGCTRELVRLQWRSNDPIDLYVIRPKHLGKMPVVLFLYNYTYDIDVFREDRWCERAVHNGFAVAGFPSALSWPRIHMPRPLTKWFVSELQEALATSAHDVQMILNYLETRGDLNVEHAGIFGQGSGGAIAILAAAADPRIAALDLMDPWGDWPDWLKGSKQISEEERTAYLKPEFLRRVSSLDPVLYLSRLEGKALRIQQLTSDTATPAAARKKIVDAVPKTALVEQYPDLTAEAKALGAEGLVGWFGEQLNIQQTVRNGLLP